MKNREHNVNNFIKKNFVNKLKYLTFHPNDNRIIIFRNNAKNVVNYLKLGISLISSVLVMKVREKE